MNVKNTKEFMNLVSSCEGKVELVTKEGDRLNLKSSFCKYVAFSEIFGNEEIEEVELICSDYEDMQKLINYMVTGDFSKGE